MRAETITQSVWLLAAGILAGLPAGRAVCPSAGVFARDAVPAEARWRLTSDTTGHPAGPWLGVTLEPVPPMLASHLGLASAGLMVTNVVVDSPADRAGIDRYDLLIEADGRPVPGEPAEFIRFIRGKQPGEILELTVLHEGRRQTHRVTLGAAPRDPATLSWKYEEPAWPGWPDPDLRGRILRRGPQGWIWEDLGPLPPDRWPDRLRYYLHSLVPGEDEVTILRQVDRDGNVLQIQVNRDRSIEVRRYAKQQGETQAEVRTFADAEALRAGDPEAYALYRSMQPVERFEMPAPPLPPVPGPPPPGAGPAPPPSPGPRGYWREWLDHYRDDLRQWRQRMEDYERDLERWYRELERRWEGADWDRKWREKWEEWSDRFFQGPLERLRPRPQTQPEAEDSSPPGADTSVSAATQPAAGTAEPVYTFEVRPDGSITVQIRNRDAVLTRQFSSEAELQAQAPQLHARFKELQERLVR